MDNGAYAKYRQENPVVNTLLSTYEHVTMFPEQLTNEEIVVLTTFGVLAIYAIGKVIHRYVFKKKTHHESHGPH